MSERKKRVRNAKRKRWAVARSPSISEIRRDFKKSLAEIIKQIVQIPSEITRAILTENIECSLMAAKETRDYDQLVDLVCSDLDFLRIHIAIGLYGLMDPRTQKIMDNAAQNSMYAAMVEDHQQEFQTKKTKEPRTMFDRVLERTKRNTGMVNRSWR